MNFFINTILNLIYSAWMWLSFKTRIVLIVLAILLVIGSLTGGYLYYRHIQAIAEAENKLNQQTEGEAQKDAERVNEAKENANLAENKANQSLQNSNKARQANLKHFEGGYNEAVKAFCKEFPMDAECK